MKWKKILLLLIILVCCSILGSAVFVERLYICDDANNQFRKVFPNNGSTIITSDAQSGICEGITWDNITGAGSDEEYIWIIDDDELDKYHTNGTYITNYDLTGGDIGEGEGIVFVKPDALWIADDADDTVYEWNISTTSYTGSSLAVQSAYTEGLTYDGTNWFITDSDASDDLIYDDGAGTIDQKQCDLTMGDSSGISWNGSHFWVTDDGDDRIYLINTACAVDGGYSWSLGATDRGITVAWEEVPTAPDVNITSPVNYTNTSDVTPSIIFNASGGTASPYTCDLMFNGTSYATNSSVADNFLTTITASTLAEAFWFYWVNCTGDLTGTSQNMSMLIDATAPIVNITSPDNSTSTTDTIFNITINSTDALASITNCTLYFNGTSYDTNDSVVDNQLTNMTPSPALTDAVWYYWIECDDDPDNIGTSPNMTITIDTTPPAWVTSLDNQSSGLTWVYWTWTNPVSDFSKAIVYINGTNEENTTNEYYNYTDGIEGIDYNLTVHTADALDNINDTDVTDVAGTLADVTAPTVNITAPPNESSTTDTTPDVQVNVTDNYDYAIDCTLYFNGTAYNESTISAWSISAADDTEDSYSCDANWHGTYVCANVVDENTGTVGTRDGSDAYMWINYTKPSDSIGATWEVWDEQFETPATANNLSIPEACWDADDTKLRFQVYSYSTGTEYDVYWYCWDGSWDELRNTVADSEFGEAWGAFEEKVYWNMSNSGTLTNMTVNTTLPASNYYYWVECEDDNSNTEISPNMSITINDPPSIDTNILNFTSESNLTTDNLTLWITTSDTEGDTIKNVTDWRINGTSIAFWNIPFEDNGTTALIDHSTNANTGTEWFGTTFDSTGGFDDRGAYDFDGSYAWIEFSDTDIMTAGGSDVVTAQMWYYRKGDNTYNAVQAGLVQKEDEFLFGFDTGDDLTIGTFGSNINTATCGGGNTNQWYHVVFVYEEATNNCSIWVNGTLTCNATCDDDSSDTANFLDIGVGDNSVQYSYFNGTIDDIQIYDFKPSQEQI
jgi:hypothetical protein